MVFTLINSIPITARFGEDTSITITGTDFTSGARVFVIATQDVEAFNINVSASNKIIATIPGTIEKGTYDLRVDLLDGATLTLENGLIVAPAFPSSPFESDNLINIRQRMLQRVPDDWDIREGSTIWDIISVFSIEFASMYDSLNDALKLGIITDSEGVYLDLKAIEYGITRLAAQKATGVVTITGTSGIIIPAGTVVANTPNIGDDAIEFITDANVTLTGGENTVDITAVLAGIEGNLSATAIDRLISSITGITAINNVAITSGGADEETDAELQARALRRIRQPSRGGNIGDYLFWASEASIEVGKVGVFPLWNGNGTVKVLFLDKDDKVPGASLITTVQDFIDPSSGTGGKSPIGATVTIAAATLDTVDVLVTVAVLPGFTAADVKTEVDIAIKKFLKDLPIGQDVLYHSLSSIIMAVTGVSTISSYTVDAGTVDVVIALDAKSDEGTITVS